MNMLPLACGNAEGLRSLWLGLVVAALSARAQSSTPPVEAPIGLAAIFMMGRVGGVPL